VGKRSDSRGHVQAATGTADAAYVNGERSRVLCRVVGVVELAAPPSAPGVRDYIATHAVGEAGGRMLRMPTICYVVRPKR